MSASDNTKMAQPSAQANPDDEVVFREPWEAKAFAIALALREAGLLSWDEWTRTLGRAIAASPDKGGDGSDYYSAWLTALEDTVASNGWSDRQKLRRCASAWQHAAQRTPHGAPIELSEVDFGNAE